MNVKTAKTLILALGITHPVNKRADIIHNYLVFLVPGRVLPISFNLETEPLENLKAIIKYIASLPKIN